MATLSFNKTVASTIMAGAVQSERLQVVFFIGNFNNYPLLNVKLMLELNPGIWGKHFCTFLN